jgi:hypothetical protein
VIDLAIAHAHGQKVPYRPELFTHALTAMVRLAAQHGPAVSVLHQLRQNTLPATPFYQGAAVDALLAEIEDIPSVEL